MEEQTVKAIFELLKLAAVGIIAALFSSRLANRDYRHRKWWELRVAAYQQVIEALSDLVYYYEKNFDAEILSRELPESFRKQLDAYWREAFPKVRKAADSGAFLFSDEANAVLKEFTKDRGPEDSYIDHLNENLGRAGTCLARLVECSKTDLKLKPGFLGRLTT